MAKLEIDDKAVAMARLITVDAAWWQVKKHRARGNVVFTVLIQNKKDPRVYYKGSDESLVAAINTAIENFEKNIPSEKEER